MTTLQTIENKIIKLLEKSIYVYASIFAIFFFVLGAIGTYFQLNGTITPPQYDSFLFDNVIYNTIHGNGLFYILPNHYSIADPNNYPNVSHFNMHNQPIIFLIIPIYYFFQSIYTLFVIQSIIIAGASIPLYFIARELLDEVSAKIIAISYLVYPSIMWNVICFHPENFATLFLHYKLVKEVKLVSYVGTGVVFMWCLLICAFSTCFVIRNLHCSLLLFKSVSRNYYHNITHPVTRLSYKNVIYYVNTD